MEQTWGEMCTLSNFISNKITSIKTNLHFAYHQISYETYEWDNGKIFICRWLGCHPNFKFVM